MTGETDTRKEMLRVFLAEHDAPCPACGYNLRGLTEATCPECGELSPRLRLFGVGGADCGWMLWSGYVLPNPECTDATEKEKNAVACELLGEPLF